MKELLDFLWNTSWWQFSLSALVILGAVSGIIGGAFRSHRRNW